MNKQGVDQLFQNYIDNFDYFNDPNGGYETYKWFAIEQVQKVWDLAASDLSGISHIESDPECGHITARAS